MHEEGGDPPRDGPTAGGGSGSWRSVAPAQDASAAPPEVRLHREFKGLTVRDLLADARLADQLPGAVRSALAHIESGDLAAAERVLPGHFAPLLAGPFEAVARRRRRLAVWITIVALAAAATVATIKLL